MDKHAARLFQARTLSLLVDGRWHTYDLVSPLTLITGDVRSGKSSLAEGFCYAIGCTEEISLMPAVTQRVKSIRTVIRTGAGDYSFERRVLKDGFSRMVMVTNLATGTVERLPTRAADDQRDISDFIFGLFGLPRELDGITVGVDDLRPIFYLAQGDISRSLMNHRDRGNTRLTILRLFLGLWDPAISKLKAQLAIVKKTIASHKGQISRITKTLGASEATTEEALRHALQDVEIQAAALDLEAKALAAQIAQARREQTRLTGIVTTLRGQTREDLRLLRALEKQPQLSPGLGQTTDARNCPGCIQPLPARKADECRVCGQHRPAAGTNTEPANQDDKKTLAGVITRIEARAGEVDELSEKLHRLVGETLQPMLARDSEVQRALALVIGRNTELSRLQELLASLDHGRKMVAELNAERQAIEEQITLINETLAERIATVTTDFDEHFRDVIAELAMPFAKEGRIDHATWLPLIDDNEFDQLSVDGGLKTLINVVYYAAFHGWALNQESSIRVPALLILDTLSAGLSSSTGNGQALLDQMYRFLGTLHDAVDSVARTRMKTHKGLLRDSFPLQMILIDNEHRSKECPRGHRLILTEREPLIPIAAAPEERDDAEARPPE